MNIHEGKGKVHFTFDTEGSNEVSLKSTTNVAENLCGQEGYQYMSYHTAIITLRKIIKITCWLYAHLLSILNIQ